MRRLLLPLALLLPFGAAAQIGPGAGISTVTDGVTTVTSALELTFPSGSLTDLGGGNASISFESNCTTNCTFGGTTTLTGALAQSGGIFTLSTQPTTGPNRAGGRIGTGSNSGSAALYFESFGNQRSDNTAKVRGHSYVAQGNATMSIAAQTCTFTGYFVPAAANTSYISPGTLTVSTSPSCPIYPGAKLTSTGGATAGAQITYSGGSGDTGTYFVRPGKIAAFGSSGSPVSLSITQAIGTVTNVNSTVFSGAAGGALQTGQITIGPDFNGTAGQSFITFVITTSGSGTTGASGNIPVGGNGTVAISPSQTVASEAMDLTINTDNTALNYADFWGTEWWANYYNSNTTSGNLAGFGPNMNIGIGSLGGPYAIGFNVHLTNPSGLATLGPNYAGDPFSIDQGGNIIFRGPTSYTSYTTGHQRIYGMMRNDLSQNYLGYWGFGPSAEGATGALPIFPLHLYNASTTLPNLVIDSGQTGTHTTWLSQDGTNAGLGTNGSSILLFFGANTLASATNAITFNNGGSGGQVQLAGRTSGLLTLQTAVNAGVGTVFQFPANGGTSGYCLTTDGAGVTSWTSACGTGATSPGGSSGNLQYNNGGVFGGAATMDSSGNITANSFISTTTTFSTTSDGSPLFKIGASGASNPGTIKCLNSLDPCEVHIGAGSSQSVIVDSGLQIPSGNGLYIASTSGTVRANTISSFSGTHPSLNVNTFDTGGRVLINTSLAVSGGTALTGTSGSDIAFVTQAGGTDGAARAAGSFTITLTAGANGGANGQLVINNLPTSCSGLSGNKIAAIVNVLTVCP